MYDRLLLRCITLPGHPLGAGATLVHMSPSICMSMFVHPFIIMLETRADENERWREEGRTSPHMNSNT